jgi:hypothetical protein
MAILLGAVFLATAISDVPPAQQHGFAYSVRAYGPIVAAFILVVLLQAVGAGRLAFRRSVLVLVAVTVVCFAPLLSFLGMSAFDHLAIRGTCVGVETPDHRFDRVTVDGGIAGLVFQVEHLACAYHEAPDVPLASLTSRGSASAMLFGRDAFGLLGYLVPFTILPFWKWWFRAFGRVGRGAVTGSVPAPMPPGGRPGMPSGTPPTWSPPVQTRTPLDGPPSVGGPRLM